MNNVEEFSSIVSQLEWLEGRLRAQPVDADSSRMEDALSALACARAVIVEIAKIGGVLKRRDAVSSA